MKRSSKLHIKSLSSFYQKERKVMKTLCFFIALTISAVAGIIPPNYGPTPSTPSSFVSLNASVEAYHIKVTAGLGLDHHHNSDPNTVINKMIDLRPHGSLMFRLLGIDLLQETFPVFVGAGWELGRASHVFFATDYFAANTGWFEPLIMVGYDPKHRVVTIGAQINFKLLERR